MGAVILIIIVASIFLVMGIFLFCGKASWLISGFNTASEQDKEAFDKKKLCRAAGIPCFVVFLFLGVMALLGYKVETGAISENAMLPFAIGFSVVILATITLVIWYMNTRCKK